MFKFKNYNNEYAMSSKMVDDFVNQTNHMLKTKPFLNVAIATGSTLEQFIALLKNREIPFGKINLYIVDDYAGIPFNDKLSCTIDLFDLFEEQIFNFKSVKIFSHDNYERDIILYNDELLTNGLDICVLGVGIDGHVGFCYPPIKEYSHTFYDITTLSIQRKKEHVKNGWFSNIDVVPNEVISLTLWGIFNSSVIMIGAILREKQMVIEKMHRQDVTTSDYPVLYLSNHKNVTVYLG